MAYRYARSASTSKSGSDGSFFLLNTLHEYEINEVSVECATELLEESKHLRTNAPAARDVALRNEQAASKVAYWASLFCRGYEVEEIEIDCIAT